MFDGIAIQLDGFPRISQEKGEALQSRSWPPIFRHRLNKYEGWTYYRATCRENRAWHKARPPNRKDKVNQEFSCQRVRLNRCSVGSQGCHVHPKNPFSRTGTCRGGHKSRDNDRPTYLLPYIHRGSNHHHTPIEWSYLCSPFLPFLALRITVTFQPCGGQQFIPFDFAWCTWNAQQGKRGMVMVSATEVREPESLVLWQA